MKPYARVIATLLAALCGLFSWTDGHAASSDDSDRIYTIGIVPQFEQRKIYATWTPIVAELSRRTGLRFKLLSTLTIQEFEKSFMNGTMDFVYMNPYYTLKTKAYLPLVADAVPLHGILVVRRDGPVNTVRDLDGQVVAFPSPNAVGASLLLRADLAQVHHVKVKPLYVKTHGSVYLHVAKGLALAGGGVEKSLNEQDAIVRDSLRVIYSTRAIPSHPLTAHTRVPQSVREHVRAALLDMDKVPEGRELLSKIPSQRLISVSLDDYSKMREWGLDAYWVEEEPGR